MLSILFENDQLIAINKPHGLLVHRSPIAKEVKYAAVQMLRDQIGQWVYPAHRLDRKTGGVLLFSKDQAINGTIQKLFMEGKVKKTYHAIVRGYIPASGQIDYALKYEDKVQDAQTAYRRISTFEIPVPSSKFPTSRYSLVELCPTTGRFHQLRKHMAHIFHPIIGDRPHGCNKQNKLWKTELGIDEMFLHASKLELPFPDNATPITIEAPLLPPFEAALNILETRNINSLFNSSAS